MEPIEKAYAGLDKRLALLEQRLDIIQKNHLYHIQEDLNSIKKASSGSLVSFSFS